MIKRAAALLTAIAMLAVFFPVMAEDADFSINEEVIAQEINQIEAKAVISGEKILSDSSYEVNLLADNRNGEEYAGKLIVGVYSDDTNEIVDLSSYSVIVPKNTICTKSVSMMYFEGMEHVKAFFWTDDGKMRPLANSLDSRESEPQVILLSEENVWATDRQNGHNVSHMLDNKKDTYLAGQAQRGKPVVINIALDKIYNLSEMRIGFHSSSNTRSYTYSVEGSIDNGAYFPMTEMLSSDKNSDLPKSVPLSGAAAYVRIKVYGYNGNDSGWIRVNSLKLFGSVDEDTRVRTVSDNFDNTYVIDSKDNSSYWFAYAFDEETYKDYTPSLGSKLYAKIENAPNEMAQSSYALHIYDNADRDSVDGAGGISVYRKLSLPENNEDYTVKFKLFIPSDVSNINWSGISLLSKPVTGGGDTSNSAALQLRFENGSGGVKINMLDSVQFNEGYYRPCFENEFSLGRAWEVEMRVSPIGKKAEITVFDGTVRETQTVGYSYTDVERVNNQRWTNSAVNYFCFNTGAGGKAEMYADDFSLSYNNAGSSAVSSTVFSQNFNNCSSLSDAGVMQAVVLKNDDGTTGGSSISSNLKAEIADSGTFGSKVLKLTDTNSTDGLVAAVPLDLPDNNNKYVIKWKMRDFNINNYSGFSLASGFNKGKTDKAHPMAIQLRYSKQSDGIQLNRYNSTLFNSGDYNAFLGGGNGNRLSSGSTWNFAITVNPLAKTMEIKATDGSKTLDAQASFSSTDENGNVTEDWADKRPDTLLFHTAAGSSADCIIDNIEVIDTGVEEAYSDSAVQGIVRLEGAYGKGKYLTLNGTGDPKQDQKIDPNRTRLAERPGLIDKNGVSFESCENPGYFLFAEEVHEENHEYKLTLKKLENTAQFKAQATFIKKAAVNSGGYTGTTVTYSPIWDTKRSICYTNTSSDPLTIIELKDSDYTHNNLYYLRSEANNFVSDNFKGKTLNSQWHNNYPWKSANQTNDSYNFSALLDYRNIEVSDGRLMLKATKIGSDDWQKDKEGETGISYNGKYSKNYVKWAGRVGVISSKKVFYRQSLVSGRFKQPESPIGYWNAFWLNAASGWPPETDIFEYLSSKGTSTWYTATHRKNSSGSDVGYGGWQTVSGVNVRTDYHDFTLDWGYNYMRFYVDGTLYRDISSADDINEQNKGLQLILNTGIGGWESEPDSTMVWNTGMECQWVRTFRY